MTGSLLPLWLAGSSAIAGMGSLCLCLVAGLIIVALAAAAYVYFQKSDSGADLPRATSAEAEVEVGSTSIEIPPMDDSEGGGPKADGSEEESGEETSHDGWDVLKGEGPKLNDTSGSEATQENALIAEDPQAGAARDEVDSPGENPLAAPKGVVGDDTEMDDADIMDEFHETVAMPREEFIKAIGEPPATMKTNPSGVLLSTQALNPILDKDDGPEVGLDENPRSEAGGGGALGGDAQVRSSLTPGSVKGASGARASGRISSEPAMTMVVDIEGSPATVIGGESVQGALDSLSAAATRPSLSHEEAREVLGAYLEVVSSDLFLERSVTKTMERLAETVEANLMSIEYVPQHSDGLSGKRAAVLSELASGGHKINLTTRVLVLWADKHLAVTPEELWDLVLEHGAEIDLRAGQTNGLEPLLAAKLRGLFA